MTTVQPEINAVFRQLIEEAGLIWDAPNAVARFVVNAKHKSERDFVAAANKAQEENKSSPRTEDKESWQGNVDTLLAIVRKDISNNYNPFARDSRGDLVTPNDRIHDPSTPDSIRGLYLITRSSEEQLGRLGALLERSSLAIVPNNTGEDCITIKADPNCRYVVKPLMGPVRQ